MVVDNGLDIYDVLLAIFQVQGIDCIVFIDSEEVINWINSVDNGTVQDKISVIIITIPSPKFCVSQYRDRVELQLIGFESLRIKLSTLVRHVNLVSLPSLQLN